jgi:hypothetical protein
MRQPHSGRRPRLCLLPALLLAAGALPAQALEVTWLGQVGDGLWFTSHVLQGPVVKYNWSQNGTPLSTQTVRIDNDATRAAKVQISPAFTVGSGTCTRLDCFAISAQAAGLVIDGGDTLVIGGSAAFADNPLYAVSHSQLLLTDAGGGASIVNNGTLRLSSDSVKRSLLGVVGTVTLSGTGQTVLHNGRNLGRPDASNHQDQILYGAGQVFGSDAPPQLIVEAGHTLRGTGMVGFIGNINGTQNNNPLDLTNRGTVLADAPGELWLTGTNASTPARSRSLINQGLMRAENGGRLRINARLDNSGGVIEAAQGSVVELGPDLMGGTLRSIGSGVLRTAGTNSSASYLTGVTLEGRLHLADGMHVNWGSGGQASTVTNQGVIALGGARAEVVSVVTGGVMTVYGDTLLAGTGRIELSDDANNRIAGYGGFIGRAPVLTLGAGQVLSGAGQINTALVNQGRIEANGALAGLRVGSGGVLTNQGTVLVSGTAAKALEVNPGQLINQGMLTIAAGSTLDGSVRQTAGVTIVQGTLQGGFFRLEGGLLKGTGTITSQVANFGGVFAPGNSPGSLSLGSYSQSAGDLVLEIDGHDPAQRDHLTITGNASFFGGRIVLDFSDYAGSGTIELGDLLQVGGTLRLQHPITGSSAGIEVVGLDAGLQAHVGWQGQSLSVSITSAVPEPATWALWLGGLAAAAAAAARRRAA